MSKKKLDLRETFIALIIKKSHFGCPKDYQSNHAFLESLTIDELQRMINEDDEDEFPYEIDYSFNDDENEFVLSYE